MKISIGSDHRGVDLKQNFIEYFDSNSIIYEDKGAYSSDSVDYPDIADQVCKDVVSGKVDFGVLICGSGIGVSISANRHKGIRAVNANNEKMPEMARRHNNANVICFGSDFIEFDDALKYFNIFVLTDFEGGERHERRIMKLDK